MEIINNIPTIELFAPGHRACAGCGPAIAVRMALKAAGANTIVIHATGCMEVVSTPYPETSWRVPWIHVAFENAAAVAAGIETSLKKNNKDTNVLVLAGDGGTFDIGLQALSGAAERGHDFCYICYDNNAYMNTGIQRSGATPKYAATTTTPAGAKVHGNQGYSKNMPIIMAAHRVYVATANIAFPQDFIAKVQKGLAKKGPAYIQVYTPCPVGWAFPSNTTIEVAKTAFNTNINPLYEIEDGFLKFTKKPAQQKPVEEFLKMQARFKHMSQDEIKEVQEHVDLEFKKLEKMAESQVQF
ncbi:MAG: pyruvate synthase subunit PorB [Candidatus Woesearchaeota archaeon]